MRETEICVGRGPLAVLLLAVLGMGLGSGLGCKSEEPAAEPATKTKAAADERATTSGSEKEPEPEAKAEPEAEADPERADKLADLDAMCKALDHDYVDGTLTDYYRDIEPRTEWGKAQRDAGNESIKPGRLLEQAVEQLSPGANELPNCRKLLDYLDDVE